MTTIGSARLIAPLAAVGAGDTAAVGAKAAVLGALASAGFPVPEGIVLTTGALAAVLAAHRLGPEPAPEDVVAAPLPDDVDAALAEIAAHFGDATLAVRSSAVDEDGAAASYAGQFATVLHVRGPDALRKAVREVWASACSARVAAYRRAPGIAPVAVLVQRQVPADVAGVAFTADPVTGDRGVVRVSAVPGLGDALVSGAAEADEWLVHGSGATPVRVSQQALTEAQAVAVGALATRIEEVRGGPQDVEWAMAGRLTVLQARPITALPVAPALDVPDGTWVKEDERHPEPLTALGASLAGPLVGRGLTTMAREAGGLIERFEVRTIGGEPYVRVVTPGGGGAPPPWWLLGLLTRVAPPLRRQMRRAQRLLRPGALEAIQRRWEEEWRPDLRNRVEGLRTIDLGALDDDALAAHLDQVIATIDHGLDVHFRLIAPYLLPVHDLLVACRALGWSEARALELLAGTSDATSAPSQALAELAAAVRAHPDAVAVLDRAGPDLGAELRRVDPALGDAFDRWCARYGACCSNDDPGSPTLAELPGALAALLRDAVRAAGDERQQRMTAAREATAAEARASLAGRSAAERERFDRVLAAALRAYPLREDAAFWTASMPAGLVRATALEFGRRLTARGALDHADDAVHLSLDALRSSLEVAARDGRQLRTAVLRARAERAYMRAHPGPPWYGPPPQPLPDLRGLPAAGRRVNEALMSGRSGTGPVAPVSGDALLRGTPASAGTFTGPVRLITGPTDFHRLRAGDVLVCPTTDPAWSVLFGVAGALITDAGNVLSHAAIVAREHAIPAVVGTGSATRTLRDGEVVTVDGAAGTVATPSGRNLP